MPPERRATPAARPRAGAAAARAIAQRPRRVRETPAGALAAAALVASGLMLTPGAAAAQAKHDFATAVVELSAALEGARGEDGGRVGEALEAMALALRQWDHEVSVVEEQVASGLPAASPDLVMAMHVRLALTYLERGRTADAVASVERALAADANDAYAHLLRGLIVLRDDPTRARPLFQRSWELDASDPRAAYWLIQTAHREGAIAEVQGAVNTLSAVYLQIAAGQVAGRFDRFLDTALFRDGAGEEPVFPLVRYQEGFEQLGRAEYAQALATLRQASAGDPLVGDPARRDEAVQRGLAALAEGQTDEALRHLAGAAARAPDSSALQRLFAGAARTAGRLDDSRAAFEQAIRLDPQNERAHLELAELLISTASAADAERALLGALETLPASGALRWLYASRFLRGRPQAARPHLEQLPMSSLLVGKGHIWAALGSLQLDDADPDAAEASFWRVVLADPNHPAAHVRIGELHRTRGQLGPAFAAFVAALLIAPDLLEAHVGAGYVYLAASALDGAVVAFRRAIALRPEDTGARYGLASALGRLGRTAESEAELEILRRQAGR